jgi:hypothetical protein
MPANFSCLFIGRNPSSIFGVSAAMSRVEAEGRFSSAWKLDEAIDVVLTLVSVDAYQQLVVERGWKEDALICRVWNLCEASFLVEPKARKASPKPRRPTH